MKFGFDIDDTLIKLREHAFHLYNKKLKTNISLDSFHSLDTVEIHRPFGLTDEQGKQMWERLMEEIYYTSCPPYEGAVEALQTLNQLGHEIYYITSRGKEHKDRTIAWLKNTGFPVEESCFFCGMKDTEKVAIIYELKLDYFIDDKPVVLETIAANNLKVFVKNQSYNKHLSLPRIIDWNEWLRMMEDNS